MVGRRVVRGLLLAGVLAAGVAATAGPASAGTVGISPPGANADSPRVAVDAAGDAFAVWTLETSSEAYVIEAAIRPAGGAWQAPVVISALGQSSDRPELAVDPAGDAAVVWQGLGTGSQLIGAAVRSAGGAWQSPVTLSEAGQAASEPAVAISAAGEATAVWQSSNGAQSVIQARSHTAAGSWKSISKISSGGNETDPVIAVNANGGAAAAWISNGNDISGAARRVGSAWSGPSGVEYTGWEPAPPRIGLDGTGDAIVLWGAYHDSEAEINSALLPPGSGFKKPVVVAKAPGEALADGLSMTEAGEATALWTLGASGSEQIQTAALPAHGSWGATASLSEPEKHLSEAVLATNTKGDALVGWDSSKAGTVVIHTRARPAGGSWAAELNLSAPGESAFIGGAALDGTGNAIEVWHRETDTSARTITAGEFPISGALLGAPAIPAAGTAGIPVSMSIGPADELTALAGVTWSLGDGSSDQGAAINHTYARPGTYAITVGGLDGFENAFGASGSISIAPRTPVLGPLKQTAAAWREGTKLARLAAHRKPPLGTTFSFSLNEAATLSFAFTTKGAGRRVKGRCVAQSKRNAHARRCTRAIVRGKLQLKGHAGANRVTFQGLLTKHTKLGPGSYTLTLTAFAEGLKSASRTLSFTIER
jgi:hypothetical protein